MANSSSFKTHQLSFSRVIDAYSSHENEVQAYLNSCKIDNSEFEVYLRCFKYEEILELWAKSKSDKIYQNFICVLIFAISRFKRTFAFPRICGCKDTGDLKSHKHIFVFFNRLLQTGLFSEKVFQKRRISLLLQERL